MRVRFQVSGRVQGVAYRAAAVEAAHRIGGLRGWVANREDGDVEGVIEGEAAEIDAFLLWCEAGPSTARVTSVDRRDDPSTHELGVFTIRR